MTVQGRYPNILLIVWDCVRADHLSCYGYHQPTTPFLETLAAEGVLFERAFSPAMWTLPAHASLFTGAHVCKHQAQDGRAFLDDRLTTLAEALNQVGYQTVGFSNNGWVSHRTGISRGFGEFHEMFRYRKDSTIKAWSLKLVDKISWLVRHRGFLEAERTNRAVQAWLDNRRDETAPFFLFVHYNEAHTTYHPPRPYNRQFLPVNDLKRALRVNQDPYRYVAGAAGMSEEEFSFLSGLYDGEIAYLDEKLEELIGFLRGRDLLDDTVVILTADHGENLGEHGLMGHVFCVYDTLLHVPLVLRYPRRWGSPRRERGLVQTVDVFATIAHLLGLEAPLLEQQLQGYSLLPEALNGRPGYAVAERAQRSLRKIFRNYPSFDYSGLERAQRAIRTPDQKYIWASDGRYEMYDVRADPEERHNLIERERDGASNLQSTLADWRLRHMAVEETDAVAPELDEELRRHLQGLGYIA